MAAAFCNASATSIRIAGLSDSYVDQSAYYSPSTRIFSSN